MTRRRVDVGERPTCTEHPGSKVYVDRRVRMSSNGFYGDRAFRCVHGDGRHLISRPTLGPRHMTDQHPSSGAACAHCGHPHDAAYGQTIDFQNTYSVLEQAKAMVRLGRGETYRIVARGIHADALRARQAGRPSCIGRPWLPRGQYAESRGAADEETEATLDLDSVLIDAAVDAAAADDAADSDWLEVSDAPFVPQEPERKYAYNYSREYPAGSLAGPYSLSATIITGWLDVFGPPILEAFAPTRRPRVLAVDSTTIKRRALEADDASGVVTLARTGERNGDIMAICDASVTPSQPILLHLEGSKDTEAWIRTFAELADGETPTWIVADLDNAIEFAVRTLWPDRKETVLYRCEEHLRERIRLALGRDGVPAKITIEEAKRIGAKLPDKQRVLKRRGTVESTEHPLYRMVGGCVTTAERWQRFKDGIDKWLPDAGEETRKWIADNEPMLLEQFTVRAANPTMPFSTGGPEAILRRVNDALDKRTEFLTNANRLNLLLGLVRLEALGIASETRYAELICKFMAEREHAGMDWQSSRDILGTSSIDDLIDDAIAAGARAIVSRQDAARRELQEARTAEADASRVAAGLQPTAVGRALRADGGHQYYRIVKGTKLADIPELAAQWNPELNDGKQAQDISAGSAYMATWTCTAHLDRWGHAHTWQRRVIDRATTRAACPYCSNKLACEATCLTTQYPDLMREWAWDLNPQLDPAKLLPGSNLDVMWRCERQGHPAYRQRIASRTKQHARCRRCFEEDKNARYAAKLREQHSAARKANRAARGEATPPAIGAFPTPGVPSDQAWPLIAVAASLGRSPATIRNWMRAGRMTGIEDRRTGKLAYWVEPDEVERIRSLISVPSKKVPPRAA